MDSASRSRRSERRLRRGGSASGRRARDTMTRMAGSSKETSPSGNGVRRITTALFVDFDNVFIGLRRLGDEVAADWGNDPGAWLRRLDHGEDVGGPFIRRVLVRNCYLNPSAFADYR